MNFKLCPHCSEGFRYLRLRTRVAWLEGTTFKNVRAHYERIENFIRLLETDDVYYYCINYGGSG